MDCPMVHQQIVLPEAFYSCRMRRAFHLVLLTPHSIGFASFIKLVCIFGLNFLCDPS
jgi:hypothetical protein